MNIVAASFTGLHNSRAFRAEKLVCVHGSATDDLQLSHQPSLPAQADVVAARCSSKSIFRRGAQQGAAKKSGRRSNAAGFFLPDHDARFGFV